MRYPSAHYLGKLYIPPAYRRIMDKCCCDMRGFLSFIVLRMIARKQMYGEEIRKEIMKRKGSKPSPGTIYPVLKFLHESGFILEVKSSSKMKKYKVTTSGRKELRLATKKFCEIFYDMQGEFKK